LANSYHFFVYVFIYGGLVLLLIAPLFRRDRVRRWNDLFTAVLFFLFTVLAGFLGMHYIRWFPRTIDPLLLQIDYALHFDTLRASQWLLTRGYLSFFLINCYNGLSIMVAVAWLAEQNAATRWSCIIGGLLCFPIYAAFPAVGPRHYDWVARVAAPTMRDCVPSMHLTWAILIALNAKARSLRIALWTYVGLIAVGTITVGEHYLIDLLVAVPYAFAVQALTKWFLESPMHKKSAAFLTQSLPVKPLSASAKR
jgi:PAP2 superfamily protein